jgi:hypothetical protein
MDGCMDAWTDYWLALVEHIWEGASLVYGSAELRAFDLAGGKWGYFVSDRYLNTIAEWKTYSVYLAAMCFE